MTLIRTLLLLVFGQLHCATILLTGGAGFIGSHTAVELLENGYDVVIADNLSNSTPLALERIQEITGQTVTFYPIDVSDAAALTRVFEQQEIHAVIHFAGYKSLTESLQDPLSYYENNIGSTLTLLRVMGNFSCRQLVFSSSACVYGRPDYLPIDEEHPVAPTNPYGRTKAMCEDIIKDLAESDTRWNCIALRYFNPIGAHPSGKIGEDPHGIPNNLVPYILKVMVGELPIFTVTGADYATADGSGVRDFIHVVDLARAHVAALESKPEQSAGFRVYNIGTGSGLSVFSVFHAVERAAGQTIPYRIGARRDGDLAAVYSSSERARRDLHWSAELDLQAMADDAVRWMRQNP